MNRARSLQAKSSQAAAQTPGLGTPNLHIPPILLEGDDPEPAPTVPAREIPGKPGAETPLQATGPPELPEAYGTGRLLLLARDPHCIYARWDLTAAQQEQLELLAVTKELVLRVRPDSGSGVQAIENRVMPGSTHQFVEVPEAGLSYTAELGYYGPQREWTTITSSDLITTPRGSVSKDRTTTFVTLAANGIESKEPEKGPSQEPGQTRPELTMPPRVGWLPALGLTAATPPEEQNEAATTATNQGSESEGAQTLMTEQQQLALYVSGVDVGGPAFSPLGGGKDWPDFALRVETDLVLYGSTDSAAKLMVDGQPVQLQPDGTFSCRLAFSEGEHQLTVRAESSSGELRQVLLKVARQTEIK